MGVCIVEQNTNGGFTSITKNNEKSVISNNIFSSQISTKHSSLKSNIINKNFLNYQVRLSNMTRYENIMDYYDVTNEQIGEGGSGIIYGAYDLNHKNKNKFTYAVKVVKKPEDNELKESLKKEIEINHIIHHDYILKCYDIFEDDYSIYFIHEYMPDGDLFDYILSKKNHCLEEKETVFILEQILLALIYLHERIHCIHKDIKPENFLIKKEENGQILVKLMDFGTSEFIKKEGLLKISQGTPIYIPPEVYLGHPYGSKVDLWALGVTVYNMVTGRHPFQVNQNKKSNYSKDLNESSSINNSLCGAQNEEQKLIHEIIESEVDLSVFKNVDLKLLVKRLLEKEPNKRCDALEALDEVRQIKNYYTKKTLTYSESANQKFGKSPVVYRHVGSFKSDYAKNNQPQTPSAGLKFKCFFPRKNKDNTPNKKHVKSHFTNKIGEIEQDNNEGLNIKIKRMKES